MITLVFAYLGGLVLNITPCLLPVLPIKILSFIKQSNGDKKGTLFHGLMYSSGIISSFAVLAGIVLLLQAMGAVVFWGFQFGSPIFLIVMGSILTGLGAHLLGVGTLISKVYRSLTGGPRKQSIKPSRFSEFLNTCNERILKLKKEMPYLGSFLFGILTTALGSACLGPFLGAAMGVALAGSTALIIGAFLCAGLGMATPYLILTMFPKLISFIPKGSTFLKISNIIAGILILATGAWLFSIL